MYTDADNISNALFQRWKSGNEAAFEDLFNQVFPALLKFAAKMMKDEGLAEEAVMDVFFRIWNKKQEIEIQGDVEQYLYKCVKHAIVDHYRKKKPAFKPLSEIDHEIAHESLSDDKLMAKELEHQYNFGINQLSPKRKEVYELSRMKGMSYREIATFTGLSLNTVENHVSASLKFLRTYLNKVL